MLLIFSLFLNFIEKTEINYFISWKYNIFYLAVSVGKFCSFANKSSKFSFPTKISSLKVPYRTKQCRKTVAKKCPRKVYLPAVLLDKTAENLVHCFVR